MQAITTRSFHLEQLGRHLRQERTRQGVTQEYLAHWVGLSRRTVASIEQGSARLLVTDLMAIETALGVRSGGLPTLLTCPDGPSAPSSRAHAPLPPPTLFELSMEDTLCGHQPRCHCGRS
jgi:transcriptional regulator with XRE-family HTH domain